MILENISRKLKPVLVAFASVFFFLLTGCKKLVEIPPPTGQIAESNIYTNDQTAIAALNGIYTPMSNTSSGVFTGAIGISLLAGLSSDELRLTNPAPDDRQRMYYTNDLSTATPSAGFEAWSPIYNLIFRCNSAVLGLQSETANALTPKVRNQLLGEAKFLRSFFYFYLVNLYGDVPLLTDTDPLLNSLAAKTAKSAIYQFVIKELEEAKALLSKEYLAVDAINNSTERVRPTHWAARALLARVYLYAESYANAETEATAVISATNLYSLASLNNAFLKNSTEAIWQLQPIDLSFNTGDGKLFFIPTTGPSNSNPVALSANLLNAFESGDLRKTNGNWVNQRTIGTTSYSYPFKYKQGTQDATITAATGTTNMKEYLMVLRVGELYLIRGEAKIKQNRVAEGIQDINAVRIRAGAGTGPTAIPLLSTSMTADAAMTAVLRERQVELFTEWGHRWFDLKRMGKIDQVMGSVTPAKSNGVVAWKSYQQLYPILPNDIVRNPNLVQNAGYQ